MNLPVQLALAQLTQRLELAQHNERQHLLVVAIRSQQRADRAAEKARRRAERAARHARRVLQY